MKTLEKLKISLLKQAERKLKNYIWRKRDVVFESDFCEWFFKTKKKYASEQRIKFWETEGKEFIEQAQRILYKKVDKNLMAKGCESYKICSPFTDDVEKLRDADSLLKEKA